MAAIARMISVMEHMMIREDTATMDFCFAVKIISESKKKGSLLGNPLFAVKT